MKAIQYFLTVQLSPGQVLLAVLVLALVFVAFLPTLLVDYVPQDQWRAFRYSLANEGTGARLQACVNLIPSFYVATGRPLVWLGECAEHAFVGFIADFRSLRPFCLLMVFVTLLLLARALRPLFDDPVLAIVTSAMVLYSPGYTFMYFQGVWIS